MKNQLFLMVRRWALALLLPRPLVGIFYLPRYFLQYVSYFRSNPSFRPKLSDMYPCLGDWTTTTPFDSHYFYQGAWLARKLRLRSPFKHVDVGSSVMTLSVISAYVETEFVDLRPIETNLSGLIPRVGSIVALDFVDDSVPSISCLHVIEHIGLGRYGDPLDTLGSAKAAAELERVLKPGGRLYLSLPVGRERVCFNAHRVHSPSSVIGMLKKLKLIEFSWVDDAGRFHDNGSPHMAEGQDYACGMFVFEKS